MQTMFPQFQVDDEDVDKFNAHLSILAPDKTRGSDPILFNRSREVTLDWEELIFVDDGTPHPTPQQPFVGGNGSEHIQRKFENKWGLRDGVNDDAEAIFVAEYISVWSDTYVEVRVPSDEAEPLAYFFLPIDGANFAQKPFTTKLQYDEFWAVVEDVQLSLDSLTDYEVLDLSPAVIYRQYRELAALRSLANALDGKADDLAQQEIDHFLSQDELNSLVSSVLRMKNIRIDLDLKLERLRDRAKDLGYVLALKDEKYEWPNGEVDEIKEGELYQPYKSAIFWLTTHRRKVVRKRRSLFGSSRRTYYFDQVVHHSKTVVRYRKTIPDLDPWVEKEQELVREGYQPYRFDRSESGYEADGGIGFGRDSYPL